MPSDTPSFPPRPYKRETPVTPASGLGVIWPRDANSTYISQLTGALQRLACPLTVMHDPDPSVLRETQTPLLIIGNLGDNQCVRDLYHRFLCATDLWYPGPGGYEIRTLIDPFATGTNIIHVGYSDEEGMRKGIAALSERLSSPMPFFREVCPTRLHIPHGECDRYRSEPYPDLGWQIVFSDQPEQKGYLAYLTADDTLLSEYVDAWRVFIAEEDAEGGGNHLYLYSRTLVWRLLEVTGLLPEELLHPSTQYMYRWADGKEGFSMVRRDDFQTPEYPAQNHALTPALGLIRLAEHFAMYHADLDRPAVWATEGEKVYAPYLNGWKPLCDGLCHGWWLSQPTILNWGLLEASHSHFTTGNARLSANCAAAVVNNQGWMPSAGDSDLIRQFPGPNLRIGAAWYNDPHLKFVHEIAPESRRHAWLSGMAPTRAFDTGLKPEAPPLERPTTVIRVDPLIYNAWANRPTQGKLPIPATTTPPTAPIERCFDKIAVRAGWNTDDDYLLIDGLGGGSHSNDDAASILDYARFGLSCVVAEDSLVWTRPEDHSGVTVTRNGEMGSVPSFAELQELREEPDGHAYLRIRMAGYAGADWTREILFRKNLCIILRDSISAVDPGEFAIEAHIRTPASASLSKDGMVSKRTSPTAGDVEFRVRCITDSAALSLCAVPINIRRGTREQDLDDDPAAALWRDRYQTGSKELTAYKARAVLALRERETVCLTHLLQIRGPNEEDACLKEAGAVLRLTAGRQTWDLPVFQDPALLPATTPPRRSHKSSHVSSKPISSLPAPVTALAVSDDDHLIQGAADGTLLSITPDGRENWKVALKGKVHDLDTVTCAADARIVIGHGEADLTTLDADGADQWTRTIERDPSPYEWWEFDTPAAYRVRGGVWNGEVGYVVATGDTRLRFFDAGGEEKWRFTGNAAVHARLAVLDIDDDGEAEIIAAGDVLSACCTCRVLNAQGEEKARLNVEGWTSSLTALAFGRNADGCFLALGANRGNNLHLYEMLGSVRAFPKRHTLDPSSIGNPESRRFHTRLGGAVTGIAFTHAADTFLVATSQGFLMAYDLQGQTRWFRLFERGIDHLHNWGDQFVATEDDGTMHSVDGDGNVELILAGGKPCSHIAIMGDTIYASSGGDLFSVGPRRGDADPR